MNFLFLPPRMPKRLEQNVDFFLRSNTCRRSCECSWLASVLFRSASWVLVTWLDFDGFEALEPDENKNLNTFEFLGFFFFIFSHLHSKTFTGEDGRRWKDGRVQVAGLHRFGGSFGRLRVHRSLLPVHWQSAAHHSGWKLLVLLIFSIILKDLFMCFIWNLESHRLCEFMMLVMLQAFFCSCSSIFHGS